MSDLRADSLSPIDAATLWPQLPRLGTEVIATRSAENLLISSGLAATGLAHLPKVPRTVVLGTRRGLKYRGVVVARELGDGAAWEVCSLRLGREVDHEATTCLIAAAADGVASRGGRRLFLRYPESTPHEDALLRGGVRPFILETLFAVPSRPSSIHATSFRPMVRSDRPNLFRLYNRSVPQSVRQHEAITGQEWRAVLDSFDCDRHFVLDAENGGLAAWVGIGPREVRIFLHPEAAGRSGEALDLIEQHASPSSALVAPEYQSDIAGLAERRGYPQLGSRHAAARRMVLLNTVKEGVRAAAVETLPLIQ